MTAILWALAVACLAVHLLSVALFLRRLKATPRTVAGPRAPVTLIRPVCGRDAFDAETLRSSFLLDYGNYSLIFCVQRRGDPALPLLHALAAAHPRVPARILIGNARATGNPKLDNVIKGWQAAKTDWVCMADSNLLLPPDYLDLLVASWGARTGLVSAPPVGIRPEGWAARLECAFLNGNQARLQYLADSLGWGFAQGKTLFFHRPLVEAAGGLRLLGRHLAEDAAATRLVRAQRRRVALAPLPFAQPIGRRSLTGALYRQLRWSRVRRDGFPLLFLLEPLNGAAAPVAACVAALLASGASATPALGYAALWYVAEAHLMRRAGWPAGWRDVLVLPLRDMAIPAIWAATFLRRGFDWRGTPMGEAAARGSDRRASGPAPAAEQARG